MPSRAVVQCLVVVDMQRAFVEGEGAVPDSRTLVAAVDAQLDHARGAASLVVHLQNDGAPGTTDEPDSWGWELAVRPLPTEDVIRKDGDSGFSGTRLHSLLRERCVDALSVCGLMSEMCVAATVRNALDLGYDVVLAHDSHATYPVPALDPDGIDIPAGHVARVAEWSLGDAVVVVPHGSDVVFEAPKPA